jgi:hypothetical protein
MASAVAPREVRRLSKAVDTARARVRARLLSALRAQFDVTSGLDPSPAGAAPRPPLPDSARQLHEDLGSASARLDEVTFELCVLSRECEIADTVSAEVREREREKTDVVAAAVAR